MIARLRGSVMHLPLPLRRWAVAVIPGRVLGELMRAGIARDPAYFDRLYSAQDDPYGFDRNDVEKLKFARLLELCGPGPFERALEVGCSQGAFTELLAPRCRELLAVDISFKAVSKAAERVAHLPQARCQVRNLPSEVPPGPFDLIVASDVLYYWTREDVRTAAKRFGGALAPQGVLVVAHYVPQWGSFLTGDEAHDIFRASTPLRPVVGERVEFGAGRPYRVDRYEPDRASLPDPAAPRVRGASASR
jgi:SAM-dependent methyltransferase